MVEGKYSQNDNVIEQTEVNATEKSRIIQVNYLLLTIHSYTFALKCENSWATVRGYQGEIIYYFLHTRETFKFDVD